MLIVTWNADGLTPERVQAVAGLEVHGLVDGRERVPARVPRIPVQPLLGAGAARLGRRASAGLCLIALTACCVELAARHPPPIPIWTVWRVDQVVLADTCTSARIVIVTGDFNAHLGRLTSGDHQWDTRGVVVHDFASASALQLLNADLRYDPL
ncbi:Reverse transcriptase domain-containing protein [Plasmodiophora brassicae]